MSGLDDDDEVTQKPVDKKDEKKPPQRPNDLPKPTPVKWERAKVLNKPTEGRKRENVVFLRRALKVELPRQPEMQQAIDLKLVNTGPVPTQQPLPPQRKPPLRPLLRQDRQLDMRGLILQREHDEIVAALRECRDEINKATRLSLAKLGEEGVNELVKGLNEKLKPALERAQKFLDDTLKEKGLPSVKPLRDTVESERDETRRAAKLVEGIDAKFVTELVGQTGKVSDDLGSALALKKLSIRTEDFRTDKYGDDKIDREKSVDKFGAGFVNTVSKLVYGDEVRIFKPEPVATDSGANLINNLGIDRGAPRFGNRNIASKEISNLLGGSVIPDACFTSHDGKLGLLMEMAPGSTMEDFKKQGFNPSPPSEDDVASIHGQLNELEWTDMLTGQGDRHDKNYLIDAKPGKMKITGIDNDFCFGKTQTKYEKYGSAASKPWTRHPLYGYTSAEMPALIDQQTYDKITKMDFDKDVLPKLKGLLTDEEIEASRSRIAEMQEHAKSLAPNYIVKPNWKDWRSPPSTEFPQGMTATEYLNGDKSTSLFKRDFGKMFKK